MGNCATYCNGQNEEDGQIRGFKQDMINDNMNNQLGNQGSTLQWYKQDANYNHMNQQQDWGTGGGGVPTSSDMMDSNGRVTKGPQTLKNGATYTGQWLGGVRDGEGS